MEKKIRRPIFRTLILFLIIFGVYYMIEQYDEINDYYIQKKENYADLKKLNEGIIAATNFDIKANEELFDLYLNTRYDENMIQGTEPNTQMAKYYWWIIMGLPWLIIIRDWIKGNTKKTELKTTQEE